MLYFTTVQYFIDELQLYLCLAGEPESRPMGYVTMESLLLVILWLAMVTMSTVSKVPIASHEAFRQCAMLCLHVCF